MSYFTYAITLIMLMLSLNAGILIAASLTDQPQDSGAAEILQYLPEGLRPTTLQDANTEKTDQNKLIAVQPAEAGTGNWLTTLIDSVKDFVTGVIGWFTVILNLLFFLLYGFIVALNAMAIPWEIKFLIGVPLFVLQTGAIFYFIILFLSSVRGGSAP